MPGTLEDYAAAVRDIIGTCRDAEQGFRAAADNVKDPALKDLFERYSRQRGDFATELETAVQSLGYEVKHPSGVGGMMHGAWMTVKGVFTGHSDHAILEETERGEDLSLKTYRHAQATTLAPEIRAIVERQYRQVLEAHDHIRTLRNATGAPAQTLPPPDSN